MADILVEIPSDDWCKLRDLYAADDPKTYLAHCTVDNYIRNLEREPNGKDWHIYSLNGDWSDGTYVLIDGTFACASTLASNGERLTRLVQLLDFNEPYKFVSIMKKDHAPILEALRRAKVPIGATEDCLFYYLPREDALKFDIKVPDGITLKPLRVCDAEAWDAAFPIYQMKTVEFMRRLIRNNPTVGAFTDDGRLAGWFVRYVDGQAGGINVYEEFRGRGIGKALAQTILRQIAEMGYMNVLTIFEHNEHSRSLFEPLGFRLIGKTSLVYTKRRLKISHR